MPFNRKVDVGMLIEEEHIGLDGSLLIGANVVPIVVEVDVLDVVAEEVFFRGRRRRGSFSSGRRRDGEARAGLLVSARAFGNEVIGDGIGGSDLLRPAGLNGADAIDGDIGGI